MSSCSVLLSTYNGELYVADCIRSILAQRDVDITLMIRDDGSSDGTISILKEFEHLDNVSVDYGQNLNYTASFLTLLFQAPKTEYYAFADQDDIWLPEKVISAIALIKRSKGPTLYCSNQTYVDKDLNHISFKRPNHTYDTLAGVLAKQQWAGCTMVFNESLFIQLQSLHPLLEIGSDAGHDSWVNLVCLAIGGEMVIDENSYILFRRHDSNVSIGTSFFRKYCQLIRKKLFDKRHRRRDTARFLLEMYGESLPNSNREFLQLCKTYDQSLGLTLELLRYPSLKCNTFRYKLAIYFMILSHRF